VNTQDLLWKLTREILNQEFPIWARGREYGFTSETNWNVTKRDYVGQYTINWVSIEREGNDPRNDVYADYEIDVDVNVNTATMTITDQEGEELDAIDLSIYFRN
jgi:hypothetical protein